MNDVVCTSLLVSIDYLAEVLNNAVHYNTLSHSLSISRCLVRSNLIKGGMLTTEEKAERKRQATARYRAKNLEKIRAYARGRMRRLREEDPDKIRKSKKLSYQKNRKAVSEGGRERRGSQILELRGMCLFYGVWGYSKDDLAVVAHIL